MLTQRFYSCGYTTQIERRAIKRASDGPGVLVRYVEVGIQKLSQTETNPIFGKCIDILYVYLICWVLGFFMCKWTAWLTDALKFKGYKGWKLFRLIRFLNSRLRERVDISSVRCYYWACYTQWHDNCRIPLIHFQQHPIFPMYNYSQH